MSADATRDDGAGALGMDALRAIDAACDAFERAWRAGEAPRIEAALARGAEGRPAVFRAALLRSLIRLERALAGSQAGSLGHYLARFEDDPRTVAEVFAELGGEETITTPAPARGADGDDDGEAGPFTLATPFRRIGKHRGGGQGEVWLARDERLGRVFALKEIRPEYASDPNLRSRFAREAAVGARLEHPNIVPVYGSGAYADGRPFYAMRFVAGETLKEAIRRHHVAEAGAPTLAQLLRRFVDVCNAIAYAHARGILHRDLKPANVMLGTFGETLVLDWGLTKELGRDDEPGAGANGGGRGDDDHETAAGDILGTIGYMSPEQARGEGVGPATDVYALGAILYEVLTGRPPFTGATWLAVRARVLAEPPERPRAWNAAAPRALEGVCLRALSKRPEDRHPDAAALARDVDRWLEGEPVARESYREGPIARLARWARRHRTAVTAGALLLVAGAGGLAVANRQLAAERDRTREARDLARRERDLANAQFAIARGTVGGLLAGLSAPGAALIPRSEALRRKLAATALESYDRLLANRPDDRTLRHETAVALGRAAAIDRQASDFEPALRSYLRALELLDRLRAEAPDDAPYRATQIATRLDLGELYRSHDRPREAGAAYEEVLRLTEPASTPDERLAHAGALLDLAMLALDLGQHGDARRRAQETLNDLDAVPAGALTGTDALTVTLYGIMARTALGAALREAGEAGPSKAALDRAVVDADALQGRLRGSPDAAYVLACALGERGELLAADPATCGAALADHDRAVALLGVWTRQFPHMVVYAAELAAAHAGRAAALLGAGEAEKAEAASREAERRYVDLLPPRSTRSPRAALRGDHARSLLVAERIARRRGDAAAADALRARARGELDEALKLNPGREQDRALLARIR